MIEPGGLQRRLDCAGIGSPQGSLEAFPLEAMAMVGSLIKAGQPVALVKVDNLLYQVDPAIIWGKTMGA